MQKTDLDHARRPFPRGDVGEVLIVAERLAIRTKPAQTLASAAV